MHSKLPLLTIGIPTWNRSKELQECIELVAAQVEAVNEDVEIFVSDNASSDGTEELLCRMEAHIGFLCHSRNKTNIGYDLNLLEVLKRSSGKYVWLLSDDDFVTDGAVAEILRIIRNHEPAHISTNFLLCDSNKTIANIQPQKHFLVAKDILHADINQTFLKRNCWLSFISSNVFRRDSMDCAEYEAHKDQLRDWIQVYIVAHVLSNKPDCYLSSFNAVLLRTGNSSFNPFGHVKTMPEAFSYTFHEFSVDRQVARRVMNEIRTMILPFRSFLCYRALDVEISPLLISWYYKLALLVPKVWILSAWKAKRFIWGKGFSLPHNLSSS
jgi:glycosyltransferase involved in cell wall biosynthesis